VGVFLNKKEKEGGREGGNAATENYNFVVF
jgi:hypothetical protein